MREVTVDVHISAPREEVFDFVADLGGRPAWTDHYLEDYRLARPNPYGLGAAARFILRAPMAKEYVELAIVEFDRPRRIVEEARVGRRGRNRSLAVYDFERQGPELTHVRLTTYSEPATAVDRFRQIGAAGWIRRNTKTALERLRLIFEDPPQGELARVSIGGYEALKAPRYGAATGMDPARPRRAGPARPS